MSILYIDGFAAYTTGAIADRLDVAGGSWTIGATSGRSGGPGLVMGSSSSKIQRNLGATHGALVVGIAVNLATLPSVGGYQRLIRFYSGGTAGVEAGVTSGGGLVVKDPGGANLIAVPRAVKAGSFFYLEIKVPSFSAAASSAIAAQLNGTPIGVSSVPVNSGSACDIVELGADSGVTTAIYDDWYICDPSVGTLTADFCGDCSVAMINPVSDGASLGFTPSTGSAHYPMVADGGSPDADASYVSGATVGNIDTYTCDTLLTQPVSVFAVQFALTAKKTLTGARSITSVVHQSSTNYAHSTFQNLTLDYATWLDVWQGNPSDESTAWTAASLLGSQFGFKFRS